MEFLPCTKTMSTRSTRQISGMLQLFSLRDFQNYFRTHLKCVKMETGKNTADRVDAFPRNLTPIQMYATEGLAVHY